MPVVDTIDCAKLVKFWAREAGVLGAAALGKDASLASISAPEILAVELFGTAGLASALAGSIGTLGIPGVLIFGGELSDRGNLTLAPEGGCIVSD